MSQWSSPTEAELLRLEREVIMLRDRVQASETKRLPGLEQQMNLSWASLGDIEFNNPYVKVPNCSGKMKKTLYVQWSGYMTAKAPIVWDPTISRWTGCATIPQPSFMPFIFDSTCGPVVPAGTQMAVVFQIDPGNLFWLWYQIGSCSVGTQPWSRAMTCPSSLSGVKLNVTPLFGPFGSAGTYLGGSSTWTKFQCASPTDIRYVSGNLPGDQFNGRGAGGIYITD